jgi:polysaccharide chain length determinant protein (PEP-CTERM system associated)
MARRELTPADYLAILKRRWVLIVLLAIIGAPTGYGLSRLLPPRYTSETMVLVQPPTVSNKFVEPVDTTGIGQRLASMQQQILSRTRLEPVIRKFGLFGQDINRVPMDQLVGRIQKAIDVSPVEPMMGAASSNLPGFYVKVTLGDPRTAQQVCSAVTSLFMEENLRVMQKDAEVTTSFLAEQLADAKKKLDDQDAKLAAFQKQYMGELPDQEDTNLSILTDLNSQLDAATQALARAQQDKSFAESMLAQQMTAWQSSQSGQSPETLDEQLSALQTQLANLRARYTDEYPDVIRVKHDIALVQKQIAINSARKASDNAGKVRSSAEPARIAQLQGEIHSYDELIAEKAKEQEKLKEQITLYQSRVQSSPAIEEQFKELTRGYQTALDAYNDLLRKEDDAAMATDLQREREGEQFTVLDPANLPGEPSYPSVPKFTLGGLAGGLALGMGLAFLFEMQDTSMRTERDVEFALRLPVLAMIPAVEPSSGKVAPKATEGRRRVGSNLRLDVRA